MGMRHLQVNTQERAISSDINRLQKFKERDVSELLRMWLCSQGTWEASAGIGSDPHSAAAPSYAEVINGLVARPINSTMGFTVDPGIIVIVDTTPLDGSAAHYVNDLGVSASSPLTVTANGTAFTRFDYLECALNPSPETVSDSRDFFDPTTGLFTAATVVKESQERLQYRIRAGTAGSGLPGSAVGWTPLAVILVPASAPSLDTCTIWDVRPLLADRAESGVLQAAEADGDGLWLDLSGQMTAVAGNFRVKHKGRWLGGQARRGSPGTDGTTIDFSDSSNGSTAGGAALWTVYAATLGGLPRWVRYTDASAGARSPRGCRGILVQSDVKPNANGTPASAITVPGIGTTTDARAIWNGFGTTAQAWVHAHGRTILVNNYPGFPAGAVANATPTNLLSSYTIIPGTHVPKTAKRARVITNANMTVNATQLHAFQGDAYVTLSGGAIQSELGGAVGHNVANYTTGFGAAFRQDFIVPMLGVYEAESNAVPSTTFSWNTGFSVIGAGSAPSVVTSIFYVTGWEV